MIPKSVAKGNAKTAPKKFHQIFSIRFEITLPETNIAPENRPSPKGNQSSNHPFSGAKMLVSWRVSNGNFLHIFNSHLGTK